MKCCDARRLTALRLGHDATDPTDWESVRRHLSSCPDCQSHYQSLKLALAAIEQSEGPDTYESRDSLWPALAQRLDLPRRRPAAFARQRWMPLLSVAAASLLLAVVWFKPQVPHPSAPHAAPQHRSVSPFAELPSHPQLRPSREAREAEERARRGRQATETPHL